MNQESETITIHSETSSGSWTLYFHSSEETKWTLGTFKQVITVRTWKDFWTMVESLKENAFVDGTFFLMRDPIPPLWENHNNIRGGYYSFRVNRKDAQDTYIQYMIACLMNKCTENKNNKVNGISISPKRGFNIIKVWNADANTYNNISDIRVITKELKMSDIMYTPFVEKKM
jgi:hypothetical protein